jgi:serine/threonine protein kinase
VPATVASQVRVVKKLATGGMADLFLGQREEGGRYRRTVVLKTVRHDVDEVEREMEAAALRNEAALLGDLNHIGIPKLLRWWEEGPWPVLEFPFVFGRNLAQIRDYLAERGWTIGPGAVAALGDQILQILQHVHHGSERVHRDVSPENVLVDFEGRVHLVDFGLGWMASRRPAAVLDAQVGKRGYVAPEVAAGRRFDVRSDLFGASVLLWELLEGRRFLPPGPRALPFPGAGPLRLRTAIWGGGRRWRWSRWPDARWMAWAMGGRPEALGGWMREIYGGPLRARDRALASIVDDEERQRTADAGFELLPEDALRAWDL